MSLPLTGVRILAVEQYGAGPWGSAYLAELGAEVIKIENPAEGGDTGRTVGPYFFANGDSHFFQTFNRNKRSIALDLKHADGRALFLRLVEHADGVWNNLRGDLPAKLGLDFGSLARVNPRIVCAHLSAYGRSGSRAAWPGYDYLMQAETGWVSVTGEPDGPPARAGLSLVDFVTGVTCALGFVAGVLGARASGRGCDVDASLFDTALHNTNYLSTWYLNAGTATGRLPRGAHPALVPSQLYRSADGWLFIMVNKEKFWPLLCNEIGRPEWITDPRFANFAARLAHRDLLTELLDQALSEKTTAAWLEQMRGKVPVSAVLDIAQALDNPYVAERGLLSSVTLPDGAAARFVRNPIRIAGAEPPARPAPAMGADTDALLTELGMGRHEIDALRTRGVIA
ncbi:MAG: CoA transferase [Rhodocyclaceae bacterium]|nr:CoA transferase [Rhodocyclaceae bacterium]